MTEHSHPSNFKQTIMPHVFIGDVRAASNYRRLRKCGITAVVCCARGLPTPFPGSFLYCNLDLLDDGTDDLLRDDVLPRALSVLDLVRQKHGKVLVYCVAGVSRSAAVVCAYIMKAWGVHDADLALGMLREKYPVACPADNFMEQLRLFGRIQCDLEGTWPELRVHRAQRFALQVAPESAKHAKKAAEGSAAAAPASRAPPVSSVAVTSTHSSPDDRLVSVPAHTSLDSSNPAVSAPPHDPPESRLVSTPTRTALDTNSAAVSTPTHPSPATDRVVGSTPAQSSPATNSGTVRYCCGRCREALFTDANCVHVGSSDACSKCYFVEPMQWMGVGTEGEEEEGDMYEGAAELSGKLLCPKCSAKLGHFNWCGSKCSCGQWLAPSFSVLMTRVDAREMHNMCFRGAARPRAAFE